MGAAESIFYDDEEEEEEDELTPRPQRIRPPPSAAAARSAVTAGAARGGGRGGTVRPRPPPSPSLKQPARQMVPQQTTTQRRRVIQQHPAAAAAPSADHQEAATRSRPPAATVDPNPPLELSGMVLGMEATGKHTLMQRLEGKEPEFSTRGARRGRHHHQRNNSAVSNTTSETPSAASDSRQQRIVTAPYQTPPNVPKWDDRIQLRVQAGRKVISKHHPVDFYVLLVDPRHDRKKFEKYISKTVTTALRAQGYGKKTNSTDQQQQSHPFCLCLLRNFRDLLPEEENEDDTGNGATIIGESDLTAWTMQILQDCASDLTDPVLQCCNTSLLNCYGLGLLHHFIYQAYVQRKRFDLEQQLRQIQQVQTQVLRGAPAALSYADYCAQVELLAQNNGAVAARRRSTTNDDETSTTSATSSRRKIVGVLPTATSASSAARGRANSGESSSTLPSSAQPSLVHDARDALEAFLESDSDDSAPQKDAEDDDNSSSSSDENDEEDFFYDESGVRHEARKDRVDAGSNGNEELKPSTQQATVQTVEKEPHPIASSVQSKADSVDEGGTLNSETNRDHSVERPLSPKSLQKQTDASQDDASNENAGEQSEHDDSDHPVVDDDRTKRCDETTDSAQKPSPDIDDGKTNSENGTNGVGSEAISAFPSQDDANEKVDSTNEDSPQKPTPNTTKPSDDGDDESESEFFVDDAAGTEDALRDGTIEDVSVKAAGIEDDKKTDLEPEPDQSVNADEPGNKSTVPVDEQLSNVKSSTPDTDQPTENRRNCPIDDDDDESESEFFIEDTGDAGNEDAADDTPRNVSSSGEANETADKDLVEEETERAAEVESKPEISKSNHQDETPDEEETEARAAPTVKIAEDPATTDESSRDRQEEASPQHERQQQPRPLPTATSAPATNSGSQISAEARAAILAAQQDMERMMLEQQQQRQQQTSDKQKKSKKSKDGEKKKKAKKEKKSKKEKVDDE